jgi:sugar lactone lactonase YvrE
VIEPLRNVEVVGDIRTRLGEGPLWDAAGERLLFVDIHAETIGEATAGADGWHVRSWAAGEPVGAAVPRAGGGLALATRTGFVLLDEHGAVERTVAVEADEPQRRMNDAKCDHAGRLWGGTLSLELEPGSGALYRLDPGGTVTRVLDGLDLPNGLDWSPDGRTFYLVDSPTRGIDAFDYDLDTGAIANRRRLVQLRDEHSGFVDGMCVDDEGCLWLAVPVAGLLLRYAPDGELVGVVDPGVTEPTSCAFGGRDRGDLFITSSSEIVVPFLIERFDWDPALLDRVAAEPNRGALLRCRPGVGGPPATPFSG